MTMTIFIVFRWLWSSFFVTPLLNENLAKGQLGF